MIDNMMMSTKPVDDAKLEFWRASHTVEVRVLLTQVFLLLFCLLARLLLVVANFCARGTSPPSLALEMPVVVKCVQRHLGEIRDIPAVPTFETIIMRQGHPVVFHSPDRKKVPVQLYILNDCFEWRVLDYSVFGSSNKSSSSTKVPLREIEIIVWDKQAQHFIGKVSEDLCFSVVTLSKSIDFECRSKDERDALCQGLASVVKKFKDNLN